MLPITIPFPYCRTNIFSLCELYILKLIVEETIDEYHDEPDHPATHIPSQIAMKIACEIERMCILQYKEIPPLR